MKQLLIATHNPAKIEEYRKLLANSGFKLISLSDLGISDEPVEDGKTFKENAEKKARFYFEKSKISTLAEDGGFEIDYLHGEPGVKSRRWPGHEATDQELIDLTLKKLQGVPEEKRDCRLIVVAAYFNGKDLKFGQGFVTGSILEKADSRIQAGFPFRSLFWSKDFDKLLLDLTPEEHQLINHRKTALQQLGLIQ